MHNIGCILWYVNLIAGRDECFRQEYGEFWLELLDLKKVIYDITVQIIYIYLTLILSHRSCKVALSNAVRILQELYSSFIIEIH